jgi:uncharacterized protein (TIGR04255 family)
MNISTHLKPIAGKNAIKEAVISIFLANPIIKPEKFKDLINSEFATKFQKFDAIASLNLNIKGNPEGHLEASAPDIQQNVGFRFMNFVQGDTSKVLQGKNEINRSFLSFHSLQYNRWNDFLQDFFETLGSISKFQPGMFSVGMSLHYIDEFYWISEPPINISTIFKKDSDILPPDFFSSKIESFMINRLKTVKNFDYFDRIEIKIENEPRPTILVSHNVTQQLEPTDLADFLTNPKFREILQSAHEHNKSILNGLLQNDVCALIGLDQKNNL